MNPKLNLTLALAVGLLGGGFLAHYLSPMPIFAQSQAPVLIPAPAQHVALMTGLGAKLGDMDLEQGTIKLSPLVKLHIIKTDRTVTLELNAASDSR
jgi:hypothetical protein